MSNNDQLIQCRELIERFFKTKFEAVLSEGQLQFDIAAFLQLEYGYDKIFVECPVYCKYLQMESYSRRSADIVVLLDNSFIIIELKYKTKKESINNINLVDQGGQTDGKRKFIEDIIKISDSSFEENNNIIISGGNNELTAKNYEYIGGFSIFCSNDPTYHNWTGKSWAEDENKNIRRLDNNNWIDFFKGNMVKIDNLSDSNLSADFSRTITYYPWRESKNSNFKFTIVSNTKD